jgi:hypothetical protein
MEAGFDPAQMASAKAAAGRAGKGKGERMVVRSSSGEAIDPSKLGGRVVVRKKKKSKPKEVEPGMGESATDVFAASDFRLDPPEQKREGPVDASAA